MADLSVASVGVDGYASPEAYGGVAGADCTTAIQAAFNAGYNLLIAKGKTYNLTGSITIPDAARLKVAGGGTLNASGMAATTPMFKNASGKGCGFIIDDLVVTGQCSLVALTNAGGGAAGLWFNGRNIKMTGSARAAGSVLIDARQLDFLNLQDIRATSVDMLARVRSDYTNSERDNTQIHFSNIFANQVNVGAQFAGIDKADISGFDISACSSGFVMEGTNKRIHFNDCHVEDFGKSGYAGNVGSGYVSGMDGYGWFFNDNAEAQDCAVDFCSAFPLTSTGAKAGLYVGSTNPVIMARGFGPKATAANAAGYKAIINKGLLRFDGSWPFQAGEFTNTGTLYVNGALQ